MANVDFRDAVLAMAEEMPNARVSTIVRLALAIEHAKPPNFDDASALAKWAERQPEVQQYLTSDRRINAIKELRALTHASLKQAKDAIDILVSAP